MMRHLQKALFIAACLIATIVKSQSISPTLLIGDQAPAVKVKKWFKGPAISSFEKGHIYIIELASVNCSPCLVAIPHMTQLARKYRGKVTFISIYTGDTDAKLERFLNRMSSKIDYTVALDDEQSTMSKTWMISTGQTSIPISFVVDQEGTIAWMGHPIDLKVVIERTIDRSFRPNMIANTRDFFRRVRDLTAKGNFNIALSALDSMILHNPHNEYLYEAKFEMLLQFNEEMAYKLGWKVLRRECKNSLPVLFYIANYLVRQADESASTVKSPDWKLVIALTQRALKLCQDETLSVSILRVQSKAYAQRGQLGRAISSMEKASAILQNCIDKNTEDVSDVFFNSIRDNLNVLREKKRNRL